MTEIVKLTEKEEEVMTYFWRKGALTVREIVQAWPEPQPHFNTVSTYVHILEKKSYLQRSKDGSALKYAPAVSVEDYRRATMKGVMRRFFDNSYMKIVSAFVQEESVSVEELKELIKMVEQNKQN